MNSMQKHQLQKAARIAKSLLEDAIEPGHPNDEELKLLSNATAFAVKLWIDARKACWNIPRGSKQNDVMAFLAETRMDLGRRIGLTPRKGRKPGKVALKQPKPLGIPANRREARHNARKGEG